jgi:signal transduction histidine kinase
MNSFLFTLIYFFYGLAFFCMGLIVIVEGGRGGDPRLRKALRPLAVFGLIHGGHEWIEMFEILGVLPGQDTLPLVWNSLRLAILAFSFLSLTAFGAAMLSPTENVRRISLLVPLIQSGIWGFGIFLMRNYYITSRLWDVADVWTRYVIGIPGALVACWGLVTQQKIFRQAGMAKFGRDSLWAAVAFGWYGLIGQIFTRQSPLPPSTFVTQELFLVVFGFPVQLLRSIAAIIAAIFVTRFLRSFEVETQRQIDELQEARLQEAQRRDALRGELLRRVVSAQEAERQRIARELHDETGQSLTAIGLGLRGAATSLRQDMDKTAHNLRQLEGMAVQSLDELRRLIADLRPSHLDDLGLGPALRWYGNEIQERTSLKVRVVAPGGSNRQIPQTISMALFRIAQEAITNVVKHANANNIFVNVGQNNGDLLLEIIDDGIGFNVEAISLENKETWGLLGMQERATLLGGQFSIISNKGKGTQISITIPWEEMIDEEVYTDDSIAAGG